MLFLWGRDKKLSESVFQRPHTRFPFLTGTKLFMQMPGSILTFTSPLYAVVRWVTGIFFMKEMSWDVVWNASVSKFVWEKLFCGAAVFFFFFFFFSYFCTTIGLWDHFRGSSSSIVVLFCVQPLLCFMINYCHSSGLVFVTQFKVLIHGDSLWLKLCCTKRWCPGHL